MIAILIQNISSLAEICTTTDKRTRGSVRGDINLTREPRQLIHSIWARISLISRTHSVDKNPKRVRLHGPFSRVMVILLNFQHIVGYYEKNRNKVFLPEIPPNNRSHGLYYILKVSAQTDKFFLRYEIPKKWAIFGRFVRKWCFFANIWSRKKYIRLSWNFQDIIGTMRSVVGESFRQKFLVAVFSYYPTLCSKFSEMTITREKRPMGTNPFRVFIYAMSPSYEQNMSSNGVYQLARFPR